MLRACHTSIWEYPIWKTQVENVHWLPTVLVFSSCRNKLRQALQLKNKWIKPVYYLRVCRFRHVGAWPVSPLCLLQSRHQGVSRSRCLWGSGGEFASRLLRLLAEFHSWFLCWQSPSASRSLSLFLVYNHFMSQNAQVWIESFSHFKSLWLLFKYLFLVSLASSAASSDGLTLRFPPRLRARAHVMTSQVSRSCSVLLAQGQLIRNLNSTAVCFRHGKWLFTFRRVRRGYPWDPIILSTTAVVGWD